MSIFECNETNKLGVEKEINVNISVVVPVFRVERYIKKCVDSLLRQTYRNYEIILVDDGSDDACPMICDQYASEWGQVRALHKENGGLSDARNFGVQQSRGEYISFVDSDDCVDENYLDQLWSLIKRYDADMAVCGAQCEDENGNYLQKVGSKREYVVSSAKAIEKVCYGTELPIYACGKLYKKDYLLKHPYPVGRFHEDVATTYLLIDESQKVAVSGTFPYHYIQRRGSILHNDFNYKMYHALDGAEEIIIFVQRKYPDSIRAAYGRAALEGNALLHRAVNSEQYLEARKRVFKVLKGKWHIILLDKNLFLKGKLQLILCRANAKLYKTLWNYMKNYK